MKLSMTYQLKMKNLNKYAHISMRSLLAIRIYYAAKYGLKSVKKSADYVLNNPPNNESAGCKNLACFKSKSDRGA